MIGRWHSRSSVRNIKRSAPESLLLSEPRAPGCGSHHAANKIKTGLCPGPGALRSGLLFFFSEMLMF
jgi:hypothetical protein